MLGILQANNVSSPSRLLCRPCPASLLHPSHCLPLRRALGPRGWSLIQILALPLPACDHGQAVRKTGDNACQVSRPQKVLGKWRPV